jgi:hypothetical protein
MQYIDTVVLFLYNILVSQYFSCHILVKLYFTGDILSGYLVYWNNIKFTNLNKKKSDCNFWQTYLYNSELFYNSKWII